MQTTQTLHYPNLRTILMVESALKTAKNPMKREQLKKKIPRKLMHQTLNTILSYLEESGKILDSRRGIVWIHNPSPKIEKAIREGFEV